jgi:hypothetical protein
MRQEFDRNKMRILTRVIGKELPARIILKRGVGPGMYG